jgi:hypothetical protein
MASIVDVKQEGVSTIVHSRNSSYVVGLNLVSNRNRRTQTEGVWEDDVRGIFESKKEEVKEVG